MSERVSGETPELTAAQTSAELASTAADAAVLQAETLAAQVVSQAASQISDATSEIAAIEQTTNDLESENEWLRTAVTNLQTQMTGLETLISSTLQRLQTHEATNRTVTEATPENLPENDAVVDPEMKLSETTQAAGAPKGPRRKDGKRKRSLRRI